MGNFEEFEKAVKYTINTVDFNAFVTVNVFEVNIRMIGGLISSHLICKQFKENEKFNFSWYNDELLTMALQLGNKLLPAFNTFTGLPRTKVRLNKNNLESCITSNNDQACTACCGTFLLEFLTLSYLTGDYTFAKHATHAMDYLWNKRDMTTNLMGLVINVDNGHWIRTDSTIGAGADSYFEYLIKGYTAFGITDYLYRFSQHHAAIMTYLHQNYTYRNVYMHSPKTSIRTFMDALMAFWPAALVEYGDIENAVKFHEFLFHIIERYGNIPEAFTSDLQIYWHDSLLRPEFAESTYSLYKTTHDPHYLHVAKILLENIESQNRVKCGFAAFDHLEKKILQDRMDSFFLAETLKYLFLIFEEADKLPVNLDSYVLSTEAHLIPKVRYTNVQINDFRSTDMKAVNNMKCRSNDFTITQLSKYRHSVQKHLRQQLQKRVQIDLLKSTLDSTSKFDLSDPVHRSLLSQMGIVVVDNDSKKQVNTNNSKSTSVESNLTFEALSKDSLRCYVYLFDPLETIENVRKFSSTFAMYSNAEFGDVLIGELVNKNVTACTSNITNVQYKIVLIKRGQCDFQTKMEHVHQANALAGLVYDETLDSNFLMDINVKTNFPFAFIHSFKAIDAKPCVLISKKSNIELIEALCPLNHNFKIHQNHTIFEFMKNGCHFGIKGHRLLYFLRAEDDDNAFVLATEISDIRFVQHSSMDNTYLVHRTLLEDSASSYQFCKWASYYSDLLNFKSNGISSDSLFSLWKGNPITVQQNCSLANILSQLPWTQQNQQLIWIPRNLP
ncbi:hypothetical protein GJ496_004129 [Pomphorhynchus laevis]|nr:hypothetical protein GJ496_004129 [Pomphorhynchus laevis]